jgi:hypothetical protein
MIGFVALDPEWFRSRCADADATCELAAYLNGDLVFHREGHNVLRYRLKPTLGP